MDFRGSICLVVRVSPSNFGRL